MSIESLKFWTSESKANVEECRRVEESGGEWKQMKGIEGQLTGGIKMFFIKFGSEEYSRWYRQRSWKIVEEYHRRYARL